MVKEEVVALLLDQETLVKRVLLKEIPRFCVFFGRQVANDVLLSHIITYLNDPNWELRWYVDKCNAILNHSAFFESIVGIATFLGSKGLEEYLLPLIMQSLTGTLSYKFTLALDSEEFVVQQVLRSLVSLSELRLIDKHRLKVIITTVLPLLCHPNPWIRNSTISLVSCIARLLPRVDMHYVIYPMIRPFLRFDIKELSDINLTEALKSPVSRSLYDQTMTFAAYDSGKSDRLRDSFASHESAPIMDEDVLTSDPFRQKETFVFDIKPILIGILCKNCESLVCQRTIDRNCLLLKTLSRNLQGPRQRHCHRVCLNLL